jgi:hypothetical protein
MTAVATTQIVSEPRTLTASEAVYSLDFVVKLVKKIHKDYPAYSVEQIADAVGDVFNQKLALMEKRLATIETIRAQYQALKSAEPIVAGTLDVLVKAQTAVLRSIEPSLLVKKPATKKTTAKPVPAKADADQLALV